jgi:hypothetical protein
VFAALAAAVALLAWLTLGQGGDDKKKTGLPAPVSSSSSSTPSSPGSITPGASPTGPAISSRPGGSGGGSTGEGGGANGGVTASGPSAGGGSSSSGSGGGSGTGGDSGGAPPINTTEVMALPICTASQLTLELAGTQNTYTPKEKPSFDLKVRNTSSGQCRVDLSQAASSITVNSASGERIWSSADCVTDKQGRWVQAPASGLTETFAWDRGRSKPQCATLTDGTPAPVGTYLVQADLTGPAGGPVVARISIQLVAG